MEYMLDGKEVTYQTFYDRSRVFSPAQVVEAANDAVENWAWELDEQPDLLRSVLEGWDIE